MKIECVTVEIHNFGEKTELRYRYIQDGVKHKETVFERDRTYQNTESTRRDLVRRFMQAKRDQADPPRVRLMGVDTRSESRRLTESLDAYLSAIGK